MRTQPDILIFGNPRSGTTVVEKVLAPYTERPWLHEALRAENSYKIVKCDGIKKLRSEPSPDIQSTEERLDLLEESQIPYFTTISGNDFDHPGTMKWIQSRNYKLIAVERADIFDNILSNLVAREHNFWNLFDGGKRPEYHHFTVDEETVELLVRENNTYWKWKQRIGDLIHSTVTYEYNIVRAKTRNDILTAAKFPQLIGCNLFDERPLPILKLISKEEKMDLITNIDDVMQWCEERGVRRQWMTTRDLGSV